LVGSGTAAGSKRRPFSDDSRARRAAVRKAKALGSREIKVMWDDMGWCRDPKARLPKIDPRVARALLDEARRQGMRASVHAPNRTDAEAAVEAGATALAHGVLEPIDDATIAVMRKRPVFYIPTMDIFEFLADTRTFLDRVLMEVGTLHLNTPGVSVEGPLLPETEIRYRSTAYSEGYRERYPNFENVKNHLQWLRSNLKKLHDAGIPIALGTDMWALPGLAVSIEMALYVNAGLPHLEAIRAATQTAARSLGIEKDRGTLEPGKRADFLVLHADPLKHVSNVRSIEGTWKAGVRVGPMAGRRGP
jgi:imidazolonepropionase-like amidohydrolase